MGFKQWLEMTRVDAYNRRGEIIFDVDGVKHGFYMDAGFFYNGWFARAIGEIRPDRFGGYDPEKAYEFAKQRGDPMPTKKPPPREDGVWVQKELF